jgi:transcriptional regulator with XRE-family HTH domain
MKALPPFDNRRDEIFARRLREARESSGISQDALAQHMTEIGFKFHQTTVNKIERGERKVPVGEAIALADAIGVSLEQMLEPEDPEFEALTRTTEVSILRLLDTTDRVVKSVDELWRAQLEVRELSKAWGSAVDGEGNGRINTARARRAADALGAVAEIALWDGPVDFLEAMTRFREIRNRLTHRG